jgi:hypothetical protein
LGERHAFTAYTSKAGMVPHFKPFTVTPSAGVVDLHTSSNNSRLWIVSNSTFTMVPAVHGTEGVTVVAQILSASINGTPWVSKGNTICHEWLDNTYIVLVGMYPQTPLEALTGSLCPIGIAFPVNACTFTAPVI